MTRRLPTDQSFDLDATLNGEQDFRWCRLKDGWHSGVLSGKLIHIRQREGGVEYRADSDLDALLSSYFRLDDGITAIWDELSCGDETIRELLEKHGHVRLRRQPDRWECVVAYICSARTSVEGIRASVEKIAGAFGDRVELDGDARRTFPTVERILEAGEEGLEKLELGLDKHRKIVAAARQISRGELDLRHLSQPQVHYAEARMRLMGCYGVGPKIADCIALFALDKMDAFPVDRWVRRAMEDRYFPDGVSSDETLVMWARDHFGEYAGYANQLLFHAQRDADNRARRGRRRTPAARCE